MPEVAQVIVDVPAMQTNQPYTYAIPERLQHQLQVGMRVIVPFGRGKREVQGFVVGIDEPVTYDGELKSITAIMDLEPVVNDELLSLSQWLADQTYAFWISCLHTMLPNVLKAKSHRLIRLIDEVDEQTALTLFNDQDEIDFEQVQNSPATVSQLLKLKRQGKVAFEYVVEDRAKVKKEVAIQPCLSFEQYEEERVGIRKNAHAQQQLINYLQSLAGQKVSLKQAQQQANLNASVFSVGEKRGWLKKVTQEVYRTPGEDLENQKLSQPLKLNETQQVAVNHIDQVINAKTAQTFLLQGVTGSGKTEVYLQAMAKALAQNRTALMLVPEIALTPQMVSRVRKRFGKLVAVLHSGLSDGERYDEWRRIEREEAKVVVGARSAVFAPLKNIGLIIMDEEHETSYKQDETPRYHARDVALWRSKYHQAPLVLGSATPSLESRARALAGVYTLLRMPNRVNQQPLPAVEVVDMRSELQRNGETNFSDRLLYLLNERLNKGEQSILMLNRRGFSSFIMCRDCGFVLKCPNCDISLTLHMDSQTMKCHYCGHEEPIPQTCPQCLGRHIRYYGTGTEKVAAELAQLLPQARIIRMDVDTTRRKGMHAKLLKEFGQQQADILLGTQMIAKGLDFPNVTLVGVLNADTGLDLPDFRASERTFDLLSQVSGRAGRANKTGQVVVQTFNPDHYAIRYAQNHDYENFFKTEMNLRHQAGYPPYFYTVRVMASNEDEKKAAQAIYEIKRRLNVKLASETVILGPTPRPIARMKRRYYYQIIVKYKHDEKLHAVLQAVLSDMQARNQQDSLISIDPEPQYFM